MKKDSYTFIGDAISDSLILEKLPLDLAEILQKNNGFIAFDGGLHIRGVVDFPEWHSLQKVWFGNFALYEVYPNLLETDIPFGQDCLGDQFILRNDSVWQLSSETRDLKNLDLTLERFLFRSEENPIEFLALQPLVRFRNEGGKLESGQLLSVYPPFCTKESKNGISLKAVPMFERLSFLADFAKQINSL